MTVSEMLARNARMYPDETALIELIPGERIRNEITWREFDEKANRIANTLMVRGIKKGDKVIHWMMNSINWLEAYFGIISSINKLQTADQLMENDLLKKADQVPVDKEQFFLLESLATTIEKHQKQLDETVHTNVMLKMFEEEINIPAGNEQLKFYMMSKSLSGTGG